MKLSTIKRSIKGKPLSHEEFDLNWTLIEAAINERAPRERYEIVNCIEDLETSDTDEVTSIRLRYTLKAKEPITIVPILRFCATVNGIIRAAGGLADIVEGNSFPVNVNTQLDGILEIVIPVSGESSPALIEVYIMDDEGNFCSTDIRNYHLIPR